MVSASFFIGGRINQVFGVDSDRSFDFSRVAAQLLAPLIEYFHFVSEIINWPERVVNICMLSGQF
jgi:hypothetical protein